MIDCHVLLERFDDNEQSFLTKRSRMTRKLDESDKSEIKTYFQSREWRCKL